MATVPAADIDGPLLGLVERASGGDEAAFARLVRLYNADMTRIAFVVCGDASLAEEAVASAWPIAWRRLASLREPDRVRAWLSSIAANEARQLLRSRRRRTLAEIRVVAPPGEAGDPGARAGDIDLANALATLAPDDRAILALRYVAGLTSQELADGLGLSASGTRARLARLLARLRSELGDG